MSGELLAEPTVPPTPGADRILLHYFDHEIRSHHWRVTVAGRRYSALYTFLRLGLMACAEFVAIPASSYFETPQTRTAVRRLSGFVDAGWIRLFGRTKSL